MDFGTVMFFVGMSIAAFFGVVVRMGRRIQVAGRLVSFYDIRHVA